MTHLEDGSLDTAKHFEIFGEKTQFAIQVRHIPDELTDVEPETSEGSWGEWRLWVADINLCAFRIESDSNEIQEVRWFLAPLFKWLVQNWMPLLHEKRLPDEGRFAESQPPSARAAYLSKLESTGDDIDQFLAWQVWGERHALRSAAEGGILPDVFFQRMEDEIEISWGDRVQPGADAAKFIVEDGIARASVDSVADVFQRAIEWFLEQSGFQELSWYEAISMEWSKIKSQPVGLSAISWYLDRSPEPQTLTNTFLSALQKLDRPLNHQHKCWLGTLSPEVAMFGDLAPNISDSAAARLLAECFDAQANPGVSDKLSELVSDEPAWSASSPWANGYSLALTILDEADPDTSSASTQLEVLLENLGILVRSLELGSEGPRGVAFAGSDLRPTILVNTQNIKNKFTGGRRFTLAHEFCHILFDQSRARRLAHSSTPWASPSVEQRANAFAAMLLMPPHRARRPAVDDDEDLKRSIESMAKRLRVGLVALKRHLSNRNEITPYELENVLGVQSQEI